MPSIAQRGALVFGVTFFLVGIAGLFVPNGMGMEADMETSGRLLGLFPVNLLHNLVHLLFGVWGLAASRGYGASVLYARIGGVDLDCKQAAVGVGQDVAFAAFDLLARVIPLAFGAVRVLHTLCINDQEACRFAALLSDTGRANLIFLTPAPAGCHPLLAIRSI